MFICPVICLFPFSDLKACLFIWPATLVLSYSTYSVISYEERLDLFQTLKINIPIETAGVGGAAGYSTDLYD